MFDEFQFVSLAGIQNLFNSGYFITQSLKHYACVYQLSLQLEVDHTHQPVKQ